MHAEAAASGVHPRTSKHTSHKHHHHKALLKPDPKVMAAVNKELGTNVNFDKLADFEGGQQLNAYIPGHTLGTKDDGGKVDGRSGVTIATGFDIGQWTTADLVNKLLLPAFLRKKYERYCNKIRQSAVDELEKSGGLSVAKSEADSTDMQVQRFHLIAAIADWNDDPKPYKTFVALTTAQQTVILSRTYHQGIGMAETKIAQKFYSAAQKGDWLTAENALRNYDVKPKWYKTRVHQEADYLAKDLQSQKHETRAAPPKAPSP
jgi:hypothetical protein